MNKLHRIEDIASQLDSILNAEGTTNNLKPASSSFNHKTPEELSFEIQSINSEMVESKSYFKGELKKLTDLAKSIDNETPIEDIPSIISASTPVISSLKSTISEFETNDSYISDLEDTYRDMRAEKNGYGNFNEFSNKYEKHKQLKSFIQEVYGDRLKDQLGQLSSYDNHLNKISINCHPPFIHSFSDFRSFKEYDLEKTQRILYENLSMSLFNNYRTLLNEIIENNKPLKSLNNEHLEQLLDEYISKNYREIILEREKDTIIRDEALSILEDRLNLFEDKNNPEEFQTKMGDLYKRINELPHDLEEILRSDNFIDKSKIFKEFNELANDSIKINVSPKIKEVMNSLSSVEDYFDKASMDKFTIYYYLESIKYDFILPKEKDISEVDIKKWEILKNNKGTKDLIEEIKLNLFNDNLRDKTFEELLVTQPSTKRSIELGYRAKEFIDVKSVPLNILNFWRERDNANLSQVFLSEARHTKKIVATEYIIALDNDLLENIKELNIPGLIDIINLVKNNPINYFNNYKNPQSYKTIQDKLLDLSIHYLENGTDEEKYFATDIATYFVRGQDDSDDGYDKFLDLVIKNIGFHPKQKLNFKKHKYLFLDKLSYSREQSSGDIVSYKSEMISLSQYISSLESFFEKSEIPEILAFESEHFNNSLIYGSNPEKNYSLVMNYLNACDSNSNLIHAYLNDENYGGDYRRRLNRIHTFVIDEKSQEGGLSSKLRTDLDTISSFINFSSEKIESSKHPDPLLKEQRRILNDLESKSKFLDADDIDYLKSYINVFEDEKTTLKFNNLNDSEKTTIQSLAKQLYVLDKNLVEPILHEAVNKEESFNKIDQLENHLRTIKKNTSFFEQYTTLLKTDPKKYSNILFKLSNLAEIDGDSINIVSKINDRDLDLKLVCDSLYDLSGSGIQPTSNLLKEVYSSKDRHVLFKSWQETLLSFNDGNFDVTNPIHTHLEYTRFRKFVDHEKVKKHIKNNFSFTDYLSIFSNQSGVENEISDQDNFEIECVAHEAGLLKDYILEVSPAAKKIGNNTLVIPNLSYGYLPVCPLTDELSELGIDFLIGTKIGSTESHNNKEVMNSRLFKRYRTNIINEQPVIVVVDGTKHLISRDGEHTASRYPDAYQGFLNQVIAINDSLGYYDTDYSDAGKSEKDIVRLRDNDEFKRTVKVYSELNKGEPHKPYIFKFWNTADMDLIIRNYHEKISALEPFYAKEISGPTMIFCNVGVLDEDIPESIKNKYPGLVHEPAYFDDSEKIINFDFGFDKYGVRYLNRLENEVKKVYGVSLNKNIDPNTISALQKYNSMPVTVEEAY